MIQYTLRPLALPHSYEVSLTLTPISDTVLLKMANWTSGSYLIRDYVANVHSLTSSRGTLEQLNKNTWRIRNVVAGEALTIRWTAFAYSTRIHDAYLDQDYGFINPPAVFLFSEDHDAHEVYLQIDTDMTVHSTATHDSVRNLWRSPNLERFLDTPITLTRDSSHVQLIDFTTHGIAHRMVITGAPALALDRIRADLIRICETTIAFWGGAPFTHYLFHTHLGPGLYNGLEHPDSCVLQKEVGDLPGAHETVPPSGYADFLALVAHEYFHAWLVKFLRPAVLLPYPLTGSEVHTETLWVFEGFTTYYEYVILRRAGLISPEEFTEMLSGTLNRVRAQEGFWVEALSEASFNAWTQLYKSTADSPYHQVSYYGKGAWLALLIDAYLRANGEAIRSLDDVLQRWFLGAVEGSLPRGLAEGGFSQLLYALGCKELAELVDALTLEQDNALWQHLEEQSLRAIGLIWYHEPDSTLMECCALKLKTGASDAFPVVAYTRRDGSAYLAGLFAEDVIVAIDHVKTSNALIERQCQQRVGSSVPVHFFRHGILHETELSIPSLRRPVNGRLLYSWTPLGQAWLGN